MKLLINLLDHNVLIYFLDNIGYFCNMLPKISGFKKIKQVKIKEIILNLNYNKRNEIIK